MLNVKPSRMLAALGRAARPVAKTGLACIGSAAISLSSGPVAHAEKVQVVETSLGLADQTRLLRHLGLRVGPDDDYVEAHFGPGGTSRRACTVSGPCLPTRRRRVPQSHSKHLCHWRVSGCMRRR